MELKVYPRLGWKSRLAMRRTRWRWGKDYQYVPRPHLIRRLSQELGMNEDAVRKQIKQEREFLLKYPQYY